MSRIILLVALMMAALGAAATPAAADDRDTCDNGQGDDKIAACSRLIQRNARDARAYNNRGFAYDNKGDHDRAIADYDQAIRLDPTNAIAYSNRCSAYRGKGEHNRALGDCDQAIRLNPNIAYAYIGRGIIYLGSKHDYDRAIADFDQAIRLNPNAAHAYASRSVAWWKKHDLDHMIADTDAAIRLDPKDAVAYNNRGLYYNEKGDYDRALADLDEAIRLDPNLSNAYSHRGYAYGRKGDFGRAMADLDKGLALNPRYPRGAANRAAILELHGDLDRAIADADEAIRLDPTDAFGWYWRGKAYFDRANYGRAIADYDQAIRLYPGYDEARQGRDRAALAARTNPDPRPVTNTAPPTAPPAGPERRVALVIGNSRYASSAAPALPNPRRDARLVADALRQAGFDTAEMEDLNHAAMVQALQAFRSKADSADWALVYYAGHGIEINRVNYLIPVDAKLADSRDVKLETVSYDDIADAIGGAKALRIIILDACRDNPFKAQMHQTAAMRGNLDRGLAAPPEADQGTLTVYSAKEGQGAVDGDGVNSPFALAFVTRLKMPGHEVRRLFDEVRDDVLAATGRRQQPYTYGSVTASRDFFFVAGK